MTKKNNKYAETINSNDKELELTQLRRNLENTEKEIEMIGKAKAETEEKQVLVKRMVELRKKMHGIAMMKYVNLKPVYEFQADQDYLTAQKELSDIEFKFECYKTDNTLAQIEANLKSFEEQLKSQIDSREELHKRIAAIEKGE